MLRYSTYKRNLVKMVGVWDTVGSLGIPLGRIPGISSHAQDFHYTRLSTTIEHSYQALALDEYRLPFNAILWKHFVPDKPDAKQRMPENRTVEQRWFAGAHSNVGGGYHSDLLSQRPLKWMQDKAEACGLSFRRHVCLNDDDLTMPYRDSYAEFLKGVWRAVTLGRRYVRTVQADTVRAPAHTVNGRRLDAGKLVAANERIDASVFRRCQLMVGYRPPALVEWARRKGLKLDEIIQDQKQYLDYGYEVTEPGIKESMLAW